MSVRSTKLRVVGIEESYENGEYRWQKIDRDPTTADLVAALREEGGQVAEARKFGDRGVIIEAVSSA